MPNNSIAEKKPRVVMLRALGLGDFLTGVPAYRAIARAFPNHERVLVAPMMFAPLANLCGGIDRIVDHYGVAPLADAETGAAVAVNLHGRGPQSHALLLALKPARTIAYAHPDYPEIHGPSWSNDDHEVERWCRLLRDAGIAADAADLAMARPATIVPARFRGATVIHPGAASEARRWPPQRWGRIAAMERRAGHRVVITGSAQEHELARTVGAMAGIPPSAVLAGRTSLPALAAIVGNAGLVVSGDTGVAHLATAYGVPSVVLFGPTPPYTWGPPAARAQHVALWKGRRGDPHGPVVDTGLAQISVDDVAGAIERARSAGGRRSA